MLFFTHPSCSATARESVKITLNCYWKFDYDLKIKSFTARIATWCWHHVQAICFSSFDFSYEFKSEKVRGQKTLMTQAYFRNRGVMSPWLISVESKNKPTSVLGDFPITCLRTELEAFFKEPDCGSCSRIS